MTRSLPFLSLVLWLALALGFLVQFLYLALALNLVARVVSTPGLGIPVSESGFGFIFLGSCLAILLGFGCFRF